jgi:hypothetical protein
MVEGNEHARDLASNKGTKAGLKNTCGTVDFDLSERAVHRATDFALVWLIALPELRAARTIPGLSPLCYFYVFSYKGSDHLNCIICIDSNLFVHSFSSCNTECFTQEEFSRELRPGGSIVKHSVRASSRLERSGLLILPCSALMCFLMRHFQKETEKLASAHECGRVGSIFDTRAHTSVGVNASCSAPTRTKSGSTRQASH